MVPLEAPQERVGPSREGWGKPCGVGAPKAGAARVGETRQRSTCLGALRFLVSAELRLACLLLRPPRETGRKAEVWGLV